MATEAGVDDDYDDEEVTSIVDEEREEEDVGAPELVTRPESADARSSIRTNIAQKLCSAHLVLTA